MAGGPRGEGVEVMAAEQRPSERYLHDLSWEEKARQNPLYGVMSVDAFAKAGSEPTNDQLKRFFSEGEAKAAQWLLPWLEATDTLQQSSILEFGCGMGRLVRAIHQSYQCVSGVDVSRTMIDRATQYTPGVTFRAVSGDGGFPFPSNTFDRVYSYAVFQHIGKWSVIKRALAEIARVLKPGGHGKFQFDMVFPPWFASV